MIMKEMETLKISCLCAYNSNQTKIKIIVKFLGQYTLNYLID